jgi:hypothetical protein
VPRPGHPDTLKPYQPGDPRRVGVKHNAATREKMKRAALKREAAKRVAREHVKQEAVQQRLKVNAETAAFDRVYRDALEYLLAHQIEPAEALREIVGDRKHPDRMRAVGEWLDRTHGKPVQVQRTVALTGQLSREEIAQLLAPAAPLLGLEAPVTPEATGSGRSAAGRSGGGLQTPVSGLQTPAGPAADTSQAKGLAPERSGG